MFGEQRTNWTIVFSVALFFASLYAIGMYTEAPRLKLSRFETAAKWFVCVFAVLVALQYVRFVYFDDEKRMVVVSPWFGYYVLGFVVVGGLAAVKTPVDDPGYRNVALATGVWTLLVVVAHSVTRWRKKT